MRSKLFLLVSVLILSLVLSACSGTAAGGTQAVNRNLTVTGTGTVYLTPDVAYIYIGVHTENEDISQAVGDNNAKAQSVATALKEFGVADKDIQTSNFSIWPSQKYDPLTGEQTGNIYMVDNSVYVTVRDLANLGNLLEAAIEAGANSINSIQFDVADKAAGQVEARQKAVENAAGLASELAGVSGVTLGDIQTITYYDSQPYAYSGYGMGGGGGGAEAAVAPIAPGQLTMSVSVTITYELK
jgi:hypothetical protein